MRLKLYVIPASHSAYAARLMVERKGIDHEIVELLSGLHPLRLRLAGFRAGTVPAVKMDGQRVQGTLAISRALEELQPEPPLFPADERRRRRVEEAERWGHEELQPVPRRLYRWALTRDPCVRRELAELNHLPLVGLSAAVMKPLAEVFRRRSGADDEVVRRDLEQLPQLLDHVDALIAQGTLGGEELNAADGQIAPSVRVLMNFADLRPWIEERPAGAFARRLMPAYPGDVPPVFPSEWLGIREPSSRRQRLQE